MKNNLLFYSSVRDRSLFNITGFYLTDIQILSELGFTVNLSNSFKDFLKFWQYDFTFIYFWTKGLVPAFISKLFNKKVIFTGGMDSLNKQFNKSWLNYRVRKLLFRFCVLFSDANIIVSKSDLRNIGTFGFKSRNLFLLPHAIDFQRYIYNGVPKKDILSTIVWMQTEGNVIRKGVDRLLYVYREYLSLNRDLTVQIIGTIGAGTVYLRNLAKKLNIEDHIVFTGRIDEETKIKCLRESKYYIQLSQYEGFGIAAVEALAAGNIVIHSGRGSLADTIGSYGIQFEDLSNYKDIASKLCEIHTNYEKYHDFICRGIQHVGDRFSYDIRKSGMLDIIQKLYK